ncbi:MAG: phenylalanine--tRNA ligase subunit beta [Prevotellaceae bacterium]|nr:phenylalanine--tRNA ligase subunit beta [Prevotellaceae bacterium]
MNISYKWLKEYIDFSLSPQETADALTSIGLEVDSVREAENIRGGLKGIVTAEVETCEPHPNSDHMHICQVNVGTGERLQIVCGASNVRAGQKVMVATIGTKLYNGDEEFTIRKSKLRGIESQGMICAEDEIGIGTDHSGIIELPVDTPVGTPAAEYYKLESDYVIEIDITPNRADACSHYGVARDLYAWLVRNGKQTSLHRPSCEAFKVDNHKLPVKIIVKQTEACPRYAAVSLTNCEVKESPKWLRDKLTVIGLRPINNIVDITNYIMMAYGQPLHCFDADMIEGDEVIVKTMSEGTPFVTLDGVEHKLSENDLAICNAREPMCIAGVFGGKGSGTYPTTRNVLLESAYFHPTWIRKSARRHGLQTDASFRFERGVDPNGQIYALKQAALLAKELAGAEVSMEIVDVYPSPIEDFKVFLSYQYACELIGKDIPHEKIKNIVRSLEMTVEEETSEGLRLRVPPYRVDVKRACDVVEDVLRIYGYNNVELPQGLNSDLSVAGDCDKSHRLQNLIGEQLVGAGFNEILNNSLQRGSYYDELTSYPRENCVALLNPLSQDLNVMRQTLLFGGLETMERNIAHKAPDLRLFEYGNCYRYRKEKRCADIIPGVSSSCDPEVIRHILDPYSEDYHLCLWMTGKRVTGSWAHTDEETSVHELKAHVFNILSRLGVPFGMLVFTEGESDLFRKSQLISNRGGKTLVELGIVSGKLLKRFDIDSPVYYADLRWNALMKAVKNQAVTYSEIAKYPAVSRDLALLVDKKTEFAEIERIAYSTEKKLLREVRLFDVYEGKNIPEGKKSYAVNFTLQDNERTLTDKAIDNIMGKLIANLTKQLDAELR